MVNRVLIRIKVVQMLYSYLLTRSEFRIDDAPETASRDRRYAYAVYIDMLLLLLELSGRSAVDKQAPTLGTVAYKMEQNKACKALAINDSIHSEILRGKNHLSLLLPLARKLSLKIENSAVFADYSKKKNTELADDVELLTTILESIIAKDDELKERLRSGGDFTNVGFDMGIAMACDTLRSYADSKQLYAKAKSDLIKSLDKAYELYLRIFRLIIDITNEQERRIENAKTKLLATSEDRNPNTKLIDNKLVEYLKQNESLNDGFKEYKIHPEEVESPLVKSLLDQILASELYKDYIKVEYHNLETDAEFWREALRTIVFVSDDLIEDIETKSLYWNDDLQIMGTFVLKTLRQIGVSRGRQIEMLPKYKDEEDEKFGPDLFKYTVENQEEYRKYVEKFIDASWDPERLAYMDIVILTTAIAEIIHYPSIPAPVSVNEYVEIANGYSTERSGSFVNGILYSVLKYLNEEGIINKRESAKPAPSKNE